MLPHGVQKVLGGLGGYGFSATMNFFTQSMKLPWIIAFIVIIAESVGAILLIAGLGTRIWALLLLAIMLGAIFTTHLKFGFFMNWFGTQSGEGIEYHLLVIGISVALIASGGGKLSIDYFLSK